MTVTSDTIRAISQGEYTVGSPGTISVADFATYLLWAENQFSLDNPGNSTDSISDLAIGLLICHYIDRAKTDQHITSENAGDGTTGFDMTGSNWMKSYLTIIQSLNEKAVKDSISVKHASKGVTRKDAGISAKGMVSSSLSD